LVLEGDGVMKGKRILLLGVVLVVGVVWVPARAGAEELLANATELERQLFADAEDGRLDEFSLVEAAFIASGVPDRRALGDQLKVYAKLAVAVRDAAEEKDSDYDRARAVFHYLHKSVFKRYGLYAVDLPGVFSRGDYNCVSATILYNALLEELDIESAGVLVPSHAYSLVETERGEIEVETTSPSGFDPLRTEEEYRKLLARYRLQGELYAVEGDVLKPRAALINEVAGDKRVAGNLTLVAIIYSNVAAARVRDGDSESALALFLRASALARDNEYFRRARDATLNNLVVGFIESKDYERAILVADKAGDLPGLSSSLRERLRKWTIYAFSKLAGQHEERGDYDRAVQVYDRGLKSFPAHTLLTHNRKATYVSWGLARLKAEDFRTSCSVFLAALKLYPEDRVVKKDYVAAVQKYLRSLKATGKLHHAEKVALFALDSVRPIYGGAENSLVQSLRLEIGLVYFAQENYEAAAAMFEPGAASVQIHLTNYAASVSNLVRGLLAKGETAAALGEAGQALDVAGSRSPESLHNAFWSASVARGLELLDDGNAAGARRVLTARTIQSRMVAPALLETYIQALSSTHIALGDFSACAKLLARAGSQLGHPDWLFDRLTECRESEDEE